MLQKIKISFIWPSYQNPVAVDQKIAVTTY